MFLCPVTGIIDRSSPPHLFNPVATADLLKMICISNWWNSFTGDPRYHWCQLVHSYGLICIIPYISFGIQKCAWKKTSHLGLSLLKYISRLATGQSMSPGLAYILTSRLLWVDSMMNIVTLIVRYFVVYFGFIVVIFCTGKLFQIMEAFLATPVEIKHHIPKNVLCNVTGLSV